MLKFADFCAGAGGFRLGLEKLGWQCVYSCELDQSCEKTYALNFRTEFDAKDIFSVKPNMLPYFDVLCAGFPCQPFSIAGKRLGFEDARGTVLFQLLNIISAQKPSIVILENVANFVSHDSASPFMFLLRQFNQLDYDVHHEILDSAYFGVPQHRKRVYIVAFRKSYSSLFFSFTKKRTSLTPYRNFIAYGDFSIPISDRWEQYIDLYTGSKTLDQLDFAVPKTRKALERSNAGVNLKDCVLQMRSSGIRACSIDAPLPTFAVSHSGGGAMIPVYTGERRHLSITEIKRIMGFPDNFAFNVSRTHVIKQLANAVCPPVVSSIGRDIEEFLEARVNLANQMLVEARAV